MEPKDFKIIKYHTSVLLKMLKEMVKYVIGDSLLSVNQSPRDYIVV